MAMIPAGALREALMALAEHARPIGQGFMRGGSIGGAVGAGLGAYDDLNSDEPGMHPSRIVNSALGGVGMGALAGAGVGVAQVGAATLRRALAEMAAERGIGRAADRLGAHAEDADRFAGAMEGRRPAPASHMEPDVIEPDMDADDAAMRADRMGLVAHAPPDVVARAERLRAGRDLGGTMGSLADNTPLPVRARIARLHLKQSFPSDADTIDAMSDEDVMAAVEHLSQ